MKRPDVFTVPRRVLLAEPTVKPEPELREISSFDPEVRVPALDLRVPAGADLPGWDFDAIGADLDDDPKALAAWSLGLNLAMSFAGFLAIELARETQRAPADGYCIFALECLHPGQVPAPKTEKKTTEEGTSAHGALDFLRVRRGELLRGRALRPAMSRCGAAITTRSCSSPEKPPQRAFWPRSRAPTAPEIQMPPKRTPEKPTTQSWCPT